MATCYRHPDRDTGVSCSSCDRPICPDCMTPTPVGMRCPECSRQRTPVHTLRTMRSDPRVAYAIMAIAAIVFVGQRGTTRIYEEGALFGPLVADGEVWRLVTSGFLHAQGSFGFIHIAFNLYLIYVLGQMLEPALGAVRFAAVYLASLLAGSAGALLVAPEAVTVGASGAVFGLMAVAFVEQRARGIDPMQSGLGPLILLNLAFTFLASNVSVGGHLGGLAGGAVTALLMDQITRRRLPRAAALAAPALVAVVSVAVALAVAGG